MDVSDHRPMEAASSVADYHFDEEPHFRQKPDGSADPAGEAGWFLQRERERLGLSLDDVSEATGLHPYHLDAIEMGDLTRMPNRADALNMVGHYSHYLGFDPEPLIHHYARILPKVEPQQAKTHPANPGPLSSALILKFGSFPKLPKFDFNIDSFPGGAGGAAASLLVAIMVFAGASWFMLDATPSNQVAGTQQSESVYPPLPDVPLPDVAPAQQQAQVEPEPATPPQQQTAKVEEQVPQQPEQLGGIEALIEQNIPDAKVAEGSPAPQAEVTATIDAKKQTEPQADEQPSRVTLRAKGPVWVRIEDTSGNVVMTQMLMAGDTYQVPNREGLVVIARDGGLLAYLIDGKEKGILGPPGEILVGRPLDLKSLEQPG
jgi:cytoskeleton protein RodZ